MRFGFQRGDNEERSRDSVHDAREKIPEQNGAEKDRNEVGSVRGGVEEFRDESPEQNVDCDPNEEWQDANGAAAHQIILAQGDRENA